MIRLSFWQGTQQCMTFTEKSDSLFSIILIQSTIISTTICIVHKHSLNLTLANFTFVIIWTEYKICALLEIIGQIIK